MHPAFSQAAHRTAPMPSRPWIMVQKWHDLLFAHWPLPPQQIRPLVPQELELDLRDGHAWVGVIPFWMSGIRARGTPAVPRLSTTPELNVRTYVTCRGIPGVYFWSLDCASRLAVWGARTFYHLPYFNAAMYVQNAGESFSYRCTRQENPRPKRVSKTCRPDRPDLLALTLPVTRNFAPATSPLLPYASVKKTPWNISSPSVTAFIPCTTARCCVLTSTIFRGHCRMLKPISNSTPWPLPPESDLPATPPLLHFSRDLEVLVWWPEEV